MHLTTITELMPPPPNARLHVETANTTFGELPAAYLDFCRVYGVGRIALPGQTRVLQLNNPYSRRFVQDCKAVHRSLQQLRENEGETAVPYPIYPDEKGLFCWADGSADRLYFWNREGEPEDWRVVFRNPDEQFVETGMKTMEFIYAALTGEFDLGAGVAKALQDGLSFEFKSSK